MSDVTATVVNGYTFVADANNQIELSKDRLNALGKPGVTMSLAGVVAVADLNSAVQDLFPGLVITSSSEVLDTVLTTFQVVDLSGNALSQRTLLNIWLADTEYGAVGASATNISSLEASVGTIVYQFTDAGLAVGKGKLQATVMTSTAGIFIARIVGQTATDTWYPTGCVYGGLGKVYTGAAFTITI